MEKEWKKYLYRKKEEYMSMGHVLCPFFHGEKICYSSPGFRHILRKEGKLRPIEEQQRRFELLPLSRIVLEKSTDYIFYYKNTKDMSVTHFWTFEQVIENKKVRVVVRQVNSGPKHFYSNFDFDGEI